MDTTTDIETLYKELQLKNQKNHEENLKAQVQLEEAIKRIKELLSSSEEQIDLNIDFEKLNNKDYVNSLVTDLTADIEQLKQQFRISLQKAREELDA